MDWTLAQTVAELRRRNTRVDVGSRGLRVRHAHRVPQLAVAVARHERAVAAWLALGPASAPPLGWDDETDLLVRWLDALPRPAGPVALRPGVEVTDWARFQASVAGRYAEGPGAPSAEGLRPRPPRRVRGLRGRPGPPDPPVPPIPGGLESGAVSSLRDPSPDPMSDSTPLDLTSLPEAKQLSFFGALFAMSAADRDMDESEDDRIFESLHLGEMSGDARKEVFRLAIQPPPLERCLLEFQNADLDIRRGLMLNLIDVVLADGIIEPGEHVGLHEARDVLGLDRDDVAALHDQAFKVQELEDVPRPVRPVPMADGKSA